MSRLFWTMVRLEAWIYHYTEKTWLGTLYTATIRYPLYLTLDKIRSEIWR